MRGLEIGCDEGRVRWIAMAFASTTRRMWVFHAREPDVRCSQAHNILGARRVVSGWLE
jgi:hypothetical protein